MATVHRISTGLWFDTQAEEAAQFYTSIFKNSSMGRVTRYGKEGFEFHHKPEGGIMTVEFTLDESNFVALNGGPLSHFSEAVSFIINCTNQEEVDHFLDRLTEGGDPAAQQCGWLKDKFGISWQVVPEEIITLLTDPDIQKAQRVMAAMLPMKKIDLAVLKQAFEQG